MSEFNFSPAIHALHELLVQHDNKVVVVFNAHDNIQNRKFLATYQLWCMLKSIGFTDSFIEAPPETRKEYDLLMLSLALGGSLPPGRDSNVDLQLKYRAANHRMMEFNDIKITFVDRGMQFNKTRNLRAYHMYRNLIDQTWREHIAKTGMNVDYLSIDEHINSYANFIRELIQSSKPSKIKKAFEKARKNLPVLLARMDDQDTGETIASLVPQTEGRIWIAYGNGHFTPCGFQSYIDNPLIIEMYENRDAFELRAAYAEHNDVFLGHFAPPNWVTSHVLLLDKGITFEMSARRVSRKLIAAEKADWLATTQAARREVMSVAQPRSAPRSPKRPPQQGQPAQPPLEKLNHKQTL